MKDLVTATPVLMSSLELVEYVNSTRKAEEATLTHANFLKKVPLVLNGGEVNFYSTYLDSQNKERPCYYFPKREACLMAMSYSYELQAKVFDRMTELENTPQTLPLITRQEQALRLTPAAMLAAKAYGFEGNQAILSADKAVKGITGVSTLLLMGVELKKEVQTLNLTPTEIGKQLNPPISAIATNKKLESLGYQEKLGDSWSPTQKGKPYAIFLDTGKKHSDGTPITQLKWFDTILENL